VRLAALDASVDDARTERALAVALASAPERLFLFGACVNAARRVACRDLARRDERYLDVAAAWLMDAPARPEIDERAPPRQPPVRSSLPVPLLEIGLAITSVEAAPLAAPLAAQAHAIELVGSHLFMAVPALDALDAEELDNAAVWIGGGRSAASIEARSGRAVIAPGDVIAGAGIMVLDGQANELRIARLDGAGALIEARTLPLAAGSRMQVQG
jgi:hypothetical protein